MAAPNIVGVTTVTGETTYVSCNGSNQLLVDNAANSNYVYRINSIIAANDNGSSAGDITVSIHDSEAGGGTAYKLAHTVSVVADSTLVILDRASSIYLPENKSIVVNGSASTIDVICSYEKIID
mgnify:CR=1 FL=1|jgi:hypothetical protein|tara:strand:- start:217 stop:588 length:372 start_codon:yes stop_codon:yes gene_type:complete